jgi:hypothetical protein
MLRIDVDQPKLLIAAARRIAANFVETVAVVAQDPERHAERGDLKKRRDLADIGQHKNRRGK